MVVVMFLKIKPLTIILLSDHLLVICCFCVGEIYDLLVILKKKIGFEQKKKMSVCYCFAYEFTQIKYFKIL